MPLIYIILIVCNIKYEIKLKNAIAFTIYIYASYRN